MINRFAALSRRFSHPIPAAGAMCGAVLLLGSQVCAAAAIPNFAPDPSISWHSPLATGDRFLPAGAGPGPIVSDPAHPYVDNNQPTPATQRIADLSNPILQPWARAEMKKWNDIALSGRAAFRARSRCYPPNPALWSIYRNERPPGHYFVQTPNVVYMMWRGDNLVRRVYLNVPHSAHPKPTWLGESVGHYEGNSLVVDTIGVLQDPLSFVDNFRTPHTDKLHVIERYTLVESPDTMVVNITIDDPGAFTTPWTAIVPWVASNAGPIKEEICADIGVTPGGAADVYGKEGFGIAVLQAKVPDF